MNFNNSSSDLPVGKKPAERKSNDAGETPDASALDKAAMDSAQKGQERLHKNEQTNSSNTIFSK